MSFSDAEIVVCQHNWGAGGGIGMGIVVLNGTAGSWEGLQLEMNVSEENGRVTGGVAVGNECI